MTKMNSRTQWLSRLAILAGIAGMIPLASLPALAQVGSSQPAIKGAASASGASTKLIAQSSKTSSKNLVQLGKEAGHFKTLLRAAQAAGLLNTFASRGEYTVFAPDDGAFSRLPQGLVEAALKPENRALLREILRYHVVPGRVTSSQLKTGRVETLSGGGLAIRKSGGKIIVNNARVIHANVQASNGIAHVINGVLAPEGFLEKYASQMKAQ